MLRKIGREAEWIAKIDWARHECIRSFAGHPLIFRDEVLGVLAVFSRSALSEEEFAWLKAFADHAAVAIANARAIEEIEGLRQRLERENTYLREEVRLNFGSIVGRSSALQKMLRQIELVAPKIRKSDVRVIAATNRNLEKEVETGAFRRDLFYRLSVFPIQVPSLRERTEDIPLLAEYFLELVCKRLNREPLRLTQQQLRQFLHYQWPGNIRELQNVIERAVILSESGKLRLETAFQPGVFQKSFQESTGSSTFLTEAEWIARERRNVLAALRESNGKVYGPSGAAVLLGVNPNTLHIE